MISSAGKSITYNYDNKPSSITNGSQTAIFYYDGSGSRVKKLTGSSTTIYIGKLYEETGGNITRYIFAGGTRIASKTSTDTYYYHQDHLGSSSVITNSSGVKVEEIRYYPFGETFSDTSPSVTKHKYTSQELDIETGLYYYNARYYDPELGRFISADTIVPDPTNPQALNRYSYVLNNPIKYTDPSGHGWFKKLRGWVKNLFRPDKIVKDFTNFSLKNIVKSGIEAGLRSQGIEPGILELTVKAVAEQGVNQLTDKAFGDSGGGGSGIINAGSSASLAPIGTVYYPRKEGVADPDPSDFFNPLYAGTKLTAIGINRLLGVLKGIKSLKRVRSLLKPGGKLIGKAGTDETIRELSGGTKAAQKMFSELTVDGTEIIKKGYPGEIMVQLEGGGTVGYRTYSTKSAGTEVTLDINIQGLKEITKVKFNP